MSNNRMWLVHKPTGKRVLLAKYYPSTSWYAAPNLLDSLAGLFDDHEEGTQWGQNDYAIEYEALPDGGNGEGAPAVRRQRGYDP